MLSMMPNPASDTHAAAAWLVLGLLVLAAAAPALGRGRRTISLVYGACAAVSLVLAAVAAQAWLGGAAGRAPVELPLGLPLQHTTLAWDPLSAFFATLINAVGALVSVYAIGSSAHDHEPRRTLPFFPAFLACMNVVLLANDAFAFLIAWELMSLTSWLMVLADHRRDETRRAAFVYLVRAAGGTFCLLLAFGLLAGRAGGYSFELIRDHPASGAAVALVLALALLGTGSKAGLVPLHAWLPLAHPVAPSHVSALMSGVMTKVAVYGFIRCAFDLARPGSAGGAIGATLVVVGAATAVYGILAAVLANELKTVLARSTVEIVGVLFAALGLALAFEAAGLAAAAAVALTTALLHAVNHALLKSTLFLGAGAVVAATGERSFDGLGGLLRRMPATGAAMLVGSFGIAALPPLNGFVSEWRLFQSVLASPTLPGWLLKLIVPAAGAALALAAALAAAAFVRLYGITFLGRARGAAAASARETDRFATSAMLTLAGGCVVLGAMPVLVIEALQLVVQDRLGTRLPAGTGGPWRSLVPLPTSASAYHARAVLASLLVAGACAALALRFLASAALRRAPAWDCGAPDPNPATQYSARSLAQPIGRVFGATVFAVREHVDLPEPGDPRPATASASWRDLVFDGAYLRVGRAVLWIADRSNVHQFLTNRRNLVLTFSALVTLLVVVAIWH